MKYLKSINESSINDIINSLKESMVELSDEYDVTFYDTSYNNIKEVKIDVLITEYLLDRIDETEIGLKYVENYFSGLEKCLEEIKKISNLLKEGLIRSHVEYDEKDTNISIQDINYGPETKGKIISLLVRIK